MGPKGPLFSSSWVFGLKNDLHDLVSQCDDLAIEFALQVHRRTHFRFNSGELGKCSSIYHLRFRHVALDRQTDFALIVRKRFCFISTHGVDQLLSVNQSDNAFRQPVSQSDLERNQFIFRLRLTGFAGDQLQIDILR